GPPPPDPRPPRRPPLRLAPPGPRPPGLPRSGGPSDATPVPKQPRSGPPAPGQPTARGESTAPGEPTSGPPSSGDLESGPVTLAGLVFEQKSEKATGAPATPLSGDWAAAFARAFARRTGQLARGHVRESIAIVLLGLGGLIFPLLPPVWVLGSALALASRLWDHRDKWVALIGPPVFTLLATVVTTALLG